MRAFILCDYEGTTGTVSWEDEDRLGAEAMAGDINATIEGLRQGGFTEFVVRDYHGGGKTIHPADIDPGATLIRGKSTPYPYGLSSDFDAFCFVGAHTMAGTATGVMCHTMNGDIYELKLNETVIGEIGGFAFLVGEMGVPTIFVSGDKAACEEAKAVIGDVETASTKAGLSRLCAECLHRSVSRKLITDKALVAAKRFKDFKSLTTTKPVTLEITYRTPEYTDRVFDVVGGERTADRTIRIVRDTVFDALKCFERGFQ